MARDVTKEELEEDVKRVAEDVDGPLSRHRYDELGDVGVHYIRKYYDSWNDLKRELGLDISRQPGSMSGQQYLKIPTEVMEQLENEVPDEMRPDAFATQILRSYFEMGFHQSKFTPREREAITCLYETTDLKQQQLALCFDTSGPNVSRIVNGED